MGNPAQPNLLSITHVVSGSTESLIKEWLFRFGLNFGKDVVPYLPLWLESFGAMKPEVLVPLLQRALRTYKFMPTVAEILAPLESAAEGDYENEWQNVQEYVERYVYPDFVVRNPPALPADIDHAVRAAGGLRYLESCSIDDLVWAKKRFCEDLARQRKTGDIVGFLPSSELRGLLDATAQHFQFPALSAKTQGPAGIRSAGEISENFKNRDSGATHTRCPKHSADVADLLSRGEKLFAQRNQKVTAITNNDLRKYMLESGLDEHSLGIAGVSS